jgi:hypothetical protein
MSKGPPVPHELQYAPPSKHALSRKIIARVVTGLALAAIGVFVALWLPRVWRDYQLLRLQRQCLECQPPVGSISFDTRTSSLPQLQRSNSDFWSTPIGNGSAVGWMPSYWVSFYNRASMSTILRCRGTAFLHRMRSPAGNERLVAIGVYIAADAPGIPIRRPAADGGPMLSPIVINLGTLNSPPRELYPPQSATSLQLSDDSTETAIYFGQPDPKRHDHFTIDFIRRGEPLTVDGWLRDDDTVRLEFR